MWCELSGVLGEGGREGGACVCLRGIGGQVRGVGVGCNMVGVVEGDEFGWVGG
jgi:hypothetical protein